MYYKHIYEQSASGSCLESLRPTWDCMFSHPGPVHLQRPAKTQRQGQMMARVPGAPATHTGDPEWALGPWLQSSPESAVASPCGVNCRMENLSPHHSAFQTKKFFSKAMLCGPSTQQSKHKSCSQGTGGAVKKKATCQQMLQNSEYILPSKPCYIGS